MCLAPQICLARDSSPKTKGSTAQGSVRVVPIYGPKGQDNLAQGWYVFSAGLWPEVAKKA